MPNEPQNQAMAALRQQLEGVSDGPGVYLMRDADDAIIYIGKARSLKKRLACYFNRTATADLKTRILVAKIARFDTIVTQTEKEALLLESNLIKRHKPRYNVVLKDDKRYPSLCLDTTHPYPNLRVVRKTNRSDVTYFGPFSSAYAVRQTLKFVNKTFKLRKCSNREFGTRSRPCLHYQMGACMAPCFHKVDPATYQEAVREVILFLQGRTPELIQKTRAAMQAAAADLDFEQAAQLRDKVFALEKTVERQVTATTDFKDRDVLALAADSGMTVITQLYIRGGYLLGTRHFGFDQAIGTSGEQLSAFIRQYYEKTPFIPREILVSAPVPETKILAEWLRGIQDRRVEILHPKRGQKVRLIEMAIENAQKELIERLREQATAQDLLRGLQKRLRLTRLPQRIECFDNSHLAGRESVAAMVVFAAGRPLKSGYRKFVLQTTAEADDYGAMAEVLTRRYGHAEADDPWPDLVVVDGGKGQLNVAVHILRELGQTDRFDVIALAKKDEHRGETDDKVYLPGRRNPVSMSSAREQLLLLQRIRDEAHRFALSFHRRRRGGASLRSILDDVAGIGPKRKRSLLDHFGSIKSIRAATAEEIAAVPGMNRAVSESVHSALRHHK